MRLSDLNGRKIALWGAGRETASLAELLDGRGIDCEIVCVAIDEPRATELEEVLERRAPLLHPDEANALMRECDLVVRSPLVSPYRPEIRALAAEGVPTTTATSLWLAEHCDVPTIGVTGTKGKTTTTLLIAHLLRAQGLAVEVGGNIGRPLTDIDPSNGVDWVVAELSSYQIADLKIAPQICVFTNLYKEHADWHRGVANYFADKIRLAKLPGVRTYVVNAADPRSAQIRGTAERQTFNEDEFAVVDGCLVRGSTVLLEPGDFCQPGSHNLANVAAALTAVAAAGFEFQDLRATLREFEPARHRLEEVFCASGISWVDDNFSSTPESVLAAIDAFPNDRLIVIVGGRFRGQDYAPILSKLAESDRVRVIAIEASGVHMAEAAVDHGVADLVDYRATLADAVELAVRLAVRPSRVVMSPAAPLMDRLTPVNERSEEFTRLARSHSESVLV